MKAGFSLIEVLVSISILSIVALGIGAGMIVGLKTYKKAQVNAALRTLAKEQLETMAGINPQEIDDTYDDNETGLTVSSISNMTFSRETDVTVNADNSRTVVVTVASEHSGFTKQLLMQSTFTRW